MMGRARLVRVMVGGVVLVRLVGVVVRVVVVLAWLVVMLLEAVAGDVVGVGTVMSTV